MVVIADALTNFQAYVLEIELQRRAREDKRSILFKKYDQKRRDKEGFYGAPQSRCPDEKNHAVYMAWWERELSVAARPNVAETGDEQNSMVE